MGVLYQGREGSGAWSWFRSGFWEKFLLGKYIKNSLEIIEIECRNWVGEFFIFGI